MLHFKIVKMKIIKLLIIVLINAWILGSCDLDRFPESNLSDADFWSTEDNFEAACNHFLIFVNVTNDIVFNDTRADFAISDSYNPISDGTRLTPSTSSDWDNPYKMIFTANNIIEKSENADFSTVNRWVAEAKFWRAYAYFLLVKKFGDVPLVTHVLDIDASELSEGRTDREIIIQQIYEDLDYSASNLPTFINIGDAGYGRISKSAALALKSRVALYVGTHQKYHGWGKPSSHFSEAITAAEAVMSEGHSLYNKMSDPYFNLFQYEGEGFQNKENILVSIFGENIDNRIRSNSIGYEIFKLAQVTRSSFEQYLCTDGLPFDQSPLAEIPEETPWSVFKNKDPRMEASIFTEGETDPTGESYIWDQPFNVTRCSAQKYATVEGYKVAPSYIDVALIRYAEVLLNYAEAKFEQNSSISDTDLDKSINLLRDRVGMPHLTNNFVTTNGLDMITEIRRERSVELAQEGFRYDDVIRWKIAENVLLGSIFGVKYLEDYYQGDLNVSEDGFIIIQPASQRNFDPSKDYLYPIPLREISLSGGAITQNPGW